MRPVGNGRPGTEVIPADWSATHAAVVIKTLNSTVTIGLAGGTSGYDRGTHQPTLAEHAPVYAGAADVMAVALSQAREAFEVGEQTSARRYEIKLPATAAGAAAVQPRMVVTVTACPDLGLVGAHLIVDTVEDGTERFSRVVIATLTS